MAPKRRYSFFMPPEDHAFIKRAVVYSRMWLTDFGRTLFAVLFIGIMVSSPGLQISAYLLPSFIATFFIIAFVFAAVHKPRVEVTRLLPPPPCAEEHFVYQVRVKNTGQAPIRYLKICEDVLPFGLYDAPNHSGYEGTVDFLEPQASVTLSLATRCKFRGIYELPRILVGSHFPSGLLRWPVKAGQKARLPVYPRFVSQADFVIPIKRVYQPGGIAISSNVGDSNEFLTTREYRRGDRLKDIHWASYARTGRLIVKEYVDEYFIRVGLLLDTALSKRQDPAVFEKRISVTAGIADSIAKKDYIIDLFAAGEELHHFQMGRALAHLENLLELLACVESVPRVNFNRLELSLTPFLRQLSSMIILLGDWDEPRARLCSFIESLGTSIRVVIIREQPLTLVPEREVTLVSSPKTEGLIH